MGGSKSRNIRLIQLGSNGIGDDGAAALRDALQLGALVSLQEINLTDNPINVTLTQQIADSRPGLVVRYD